MAVYSIGPVANQDPTLAPVAFLVELRVANTTLAPVDLTVTAYDAPGSVNPGAPETLYFSQTFSLAPNTVALFSIDTSAVTAYEIRVATPGLAGDISIAAQGRDEFGFFVPEQAFPNGDWSIATTV